MRKPVSNHLRILLYREIPSLMNRTSKRMPPRRFVTPRSDGIFRARIRSRIRTYAQNVYNAIHFHLYTWLEYRRCAWARGKEGERKMIRSRIRWHQSAYRLAGYRSFGRFVKHEQCASTLFNINVGYACIMSPDIYIADHALPPRRFYYL